MTRLCTVPVEQRGFFRVDAVAVHSGALRDKIHKLEHEGRSGWAMIFGRLLVGWMESHPETPEEVLMSVYARLGGTFSAWMATGHPRFPRAGLVAHYADHPDGSHRQPAAGPDLIERLSYAPDVRTRQAATRDPRLPLPRLLEALALPELASSAGADPALPPGEMAVILDEAGVPA